MSNTKFLAEAQKCETADTKERLKKKAASATKKANNNKRKKIMMMMALPISGAPINNAMATTKKHEVLKNKTTKAQLASVNCVNSQVLLNLSMFPTTPVSVTKRVRLQRN